MTRALKIAGSLFLAATLGVAIFLWARPDSASDSEFEQTRSYSASFASADRDTFTVMTYNLGLLVGSSGNGSRSSPSDEWSSNVSGALRLVQEIDPDFVGLQGVPLDPDRTVNRSVVDSIAEPLGYGSGATARHVPPPSAFPLFSQGDGRHSGEALLSRYPIRRHLRSELPAPPSGFWSTDDQPGQLVQLSAVDVGGWPLIIMNTHLSASETSTREEQARKVLEYYGRLAAQGFPVLLLGTFNSLMPGAITPGVPDRYANDQTMDILLAEGQVYPALSSEVTTVTGGNVSTFPSTDPKWKIDYILHSPDRIIPVNAEVHCGPSPPPSPHCAVSMSFLLPRPKENLPEGPLPDNRLPSLDSLTAVDNSQ